MTSRGSRRVGRRDGNGRGGQGGLLLPLLALGLAAGLVGGASLWLVATPPDTGDGTGETRARLSAARQALLAHASAYPDLYGPAGAGPGHLVCPDTDTPPGVRLSPSPVDTGARRAGSAFRSDGPDPPCGRGTLAVGRLPRHVSLPAGRRAFHAEREQRFVYAVSTRYVNNPPGRGVVPASDAITSSLSRSGSTSGEPLAETVDEVVAIVLDPGGVALPEVALAGAGDPRDLLERVRDVVRREAGARAARSLPHAFLRRDALLDAAALRVAAWFVDTATSVAVGHCRNADGSSMPEPIAPELADGAPGAAPSGGRLVCRPRWPTAIRCDDEHDSLRWLGEIAGRERATRGESIADARTAEDCEPAEDASVARPAALPDAIENTPLARHWFVRNEWSRFVAISRDASCRGRASDRCRLQTAGRDDGKISIRLVLARAESATSTRPPAERR